MTRIVVISAGLREPSSTRLLADRLADATARNLGGEAEIEVVNLRDHAHDLTNNLLTSFPSAALRTVLDTVAAADGLIAVTPIFNASYSGLFKTFFDVLEPGTLAGKPVLMGATGGTARHSLALEHALRPMFAYLRAITVPTTVYAATEDWGAPGEATGGLIERIDRAGAELADLLKGRPVTEERDPFDDPVPFERLLAGE
jgi:FMN reductase